MKIKRFFGLVILAAIGVLLVAACGPAAPEAPAAQAEQAEHEDDSGHSHSPDDHMAGAHNVPEEAAAVPNPIEADHESLEAGEQLYATNCAVCHGESGKGDGPGAAELEKPPANLNEGHVQGLSDGALFYIISHGRPDTPMPAWDNILGEDERWQVVNYLRTFAEGEAHEDGEQHADEAGSDEEHHEEDEQHADEAGSEEEHHADEVDAEAEHHADEADSEEEHHADDEHHEEEEEHHEDEDEHHEEEEHHEEDGG
jgi:mono/diheme cytochrome c family protein